MSTGYQWHPMIKMVPDNGPDEIYDLTQHFSDAGGPVSNILSYPSENDLNQDINGGLSKVIKGFRPLIRMVFDIITTEDQQTLATITNRLSRDDWAVYLSLDGGLIYRQIEMDKAPSPKPFMGKTVAGARWEIRLRAKSRIDEQPTFVEGW